MTILQILRATIRVCLSCVLGWYLMAVPFLFGLNGWGFFHSGFVVIAFPFTAALSYWVLRKVPPFKAHAAHGPRNQHRQTG